MTILKGPGNWKVSGKRLPELGLTEFFGGKANSVKNAQARKAISIWQGSNSKSKPNPKANTPKKGDVSFDIGEQDALRGGVLGSSTSFSGPTSSSGVTSSSRSSSSGSRSSSSNDDGGDNSGPSLTDIINQEFDSVLADLDKQAGQAQQSIVPQRQLLGEAYQGNLNEAGLRQQNEQAALKSALNDYSQRGIARFSLTGGFGSSSGEALAERLGRYAVQEQSKLQNGYATMRNKLATSYQQGLADLEGQLQQRLSTIDSLKSRARSEKARAVFDAWKSYTDQVAQFNQTMAQYDTTLRQIAAEKSGNLGLLVNNQPNFFDRKNFGIMSPVEPVGEMGTIQPGQGIPATVYNTQGGSNEEDIYDQLQNYATLSQ